MPSALVTDRMLRLEERKKVVHLEAEHGAAGLGQQKLRLAPLLVDRHLAQGEEGEAGDEQRRQRPFSQRLALCHIMALDNRRVTGVCRMATIVFSHPEKSFLWVLVVDRNQLALQTHFDCCLLANPRQDGSSPNGAQAARG